MAAHDWQTPEASVREIIRAALVSAWNPAKIFSDPPEVEQAAGQVAAFVLLLSVEQDEEQATMTTDAVRLEYVVTGRFPRPGSGSIHTARAAKLSSLKALLFDGPRLVGSGGQEFSREWISDTLVPDSEGEREREASQAFYTVSTRFVVVVDVEAT